MFKQFFLIGAVSIAANTVSAASPIGSGAFGQQSECMAVANQKLNDYSYGVDPDGVALYFDDNGKTVIIDQNKIVSRKNENGEETIVYKSKRMKTDKFPATEFETINNTVVVKRDASGKMTGFSKLYNVKEQAENLKKYQLTDMKFYITKSINHEFVNSGDECLLNQTIAIEMEDEKSKEEKSVYFDKKFCDSLAPILNNMGKQNAAQCGNLIASAQMNFKNRKEVLAKEEKNLKLMHSFAGDSVNPNVFSLTAALQSCLPIQAGMFGGGGIGIGYGTGGYYNAGGAKAVDKKTTAPVESTKSSR